MAAKKKAKKKSVKKAARKVAKKTAKKAGKQTGKKSPGYMPAGVQNAIPYLIVKGGIQALEFYKKAFGAREKGRLVMPDGKLAHGELEIGGARVMLSEEVSDWGNHSPRTLGGTPVSITIYVRNADALFERALKAGARSERPMADQFYGDRMGTLIDPFGHRWSIATHKEDVTFREMQKRMDRMFHEDS